MSSQVANAQGELDLVLGSLIDGRIEEEGIWNGGFRANSGQDLVKLRFK